MPDNNRPPSNLGGNEGGSIAKAQLDKLLDLTNIRRELSRKSYARYVEYVHQGRWIPAKHLLFICNKVETFIQEKTGHPYDILVLQMPPQHGKSQSITETLPSWYLGKWPYHRVIEVSYNDTFAQKFGRRNREKIKDFGGNLFGIALSKGKDSNEEFELSNNVGGMISRGIMSGVTGNPANLIIVDDPIKNREEADSENNREKQWDEWQNSIKTRLAAGAKVIVIMCLTGDTPILMADGTEKSLRNIHIGDNVATYQNGKLAVSVVQNWKNQGSDLVFTIRMESGIIIKGNERHPFLVERDGYTEWVRIKNLKAGDKILRARRTGGNGEEFCVQKKTAINPQSARDIATPITISSFGRVGTDLRRLTRNPDERRDLSTGTESVLPNTTLCLLRKTESAPCVENCLAQTYEHIGVENSASTMIMSQEKCEDSCATTVILQSGMEKQKKNYSLPLNMFEIIPDSIVDIVESGYEDVFDIQVESTENFIANGLVSHNTRWHEDDLAGKILKSEKNVTLISLPCEAEENDPLGREAGQALFPEIGKDDEWLKQFKDSFMHDPFIEGGGARAWNALYQQRPSALEGAMIKRQWWKFYKEVPKNYNQLLQSWDMTFKDSDGSDFVSGQVWGNVGANIYMLPDREYGRMDFTATISAFRSLTSRNPGTNIKLVEDKANGPAVIAMLRKEIRGIIPINPKGSKIARVSSVTPLIEAGNVYLPDPSICPWINEFIEECASFPNGAHDDQVDAMSQALNRLMYSRNDAPLPEKRDTFIYRDAQETNGYTGGEIPRSYIDW